MYDYMIVLLILSSVFGYILPYFVQPIILLTILFLPWLLQAASCFRQARNQNVLVVFVFLFAYASLSMLWVPDFKHCFMLLVRALIHMVMCLEIIVFSQKANLPFDSIAKGWVGAFLLTAAVAVFEMTTDHHLAVMAHEDLIESAGGHRAAVTFHNYNTYSLFIVFCLPFLLYRLLMEGRKRRRLALWGILLLMVSIVLLNASRGAILSMVVMVGVFMLCASKGKNKRMKRNVLLLIILLAIMMVVLGGFLLEAIITRTAGKDVFRDSTRMVLWGSSLQLFAQSWGFGQGFGSMIPVLTTFPGNTTDLTYSHNLLFELLLEGGVIFFFCFVALLLILFRAARKEKDVPRRMVLFASLFAFPLYSIINSVYTSPTFIWLFFACLGVFASTPRLKTAFV